MSLQQTKGVSSRIDFERRKNAVLAEQAQAAEPDDDDQHTRNERSQLAEHEAACFQDPILGFTAWRGK